jgi:hypothetical protein
MFSIFSKISKSILVTVAAVVHLAPGAATAQVPSPGDILGFDVGDDYKLADYDESIRYFRALESASDSVQLKHIGYTSEGREWYMAVISSPENLANLDRYRQIAQQIAHPGDLDDETASALAREGKAFVHIDGGLHATEAAGAQHTIQLAYELLSNQDDPKYQAILDNVVFLLWPSLNPDGQNIVVDWYRSNVGTPFEVAPLIQLYQKYIGHDNNRDGYMLNTVESRVVTRTWRDWEPHIIYVQHQTAPFPTRIWLPPFAEPIASQAPPLMSRTVNSIGMAIAHGLESNGQEGATHMGTGYDSWYPGYIDYMPMFQNIPAFWTETALYRYATPKFYTVSDFPEKDKSLRAEALYVSPWQGGWWRLKDAVDYMVTASVSTLDYAAKYKYDVLYNRYQAGRDTIRKYEQEPPFAYFIPQTQRDPVAAVEMLRRLAFHGIEVYQLTESVSHDGSNYPANTWVIPMNQEFAALVRQLFNVQRYPDLREYPEGPPEQPYDAAGWTLPYLMDVNVVAANSPLDQDARNALRLVSGQALDWRDNAASETDASRIDSVIGAGFNTHAGAAAIAPPAGRAPGSGNNLLLDPVQNNSYRAMNRAREMGGTVRFNPASGPGNYGRYAISGISRSDQDILVRDYALIAARSNTSAGNVVSSRVGLYRPWSPSIDEGWTRWLLERHGFDFTNLRDNHIQQGDLRRKFDVIIIPDIRPNSIMDGNAKGSTRAQYTGGLGPEGVNQLNDFVRDGGTLVTMNKSSRFAIDALHLPVKDVVESLARSEYFVGASILQVDVDQSHPVMSGMAAQSRVFVDRSPVFTTLDGFEGSAMAKYQQAGSPLSSGYMLGEEYLNGYAAALDVHHGDGHVLLLGFRPQWRGQTFGTFKVLFNTALYGGEFAASVSGNDDFWTPPAKVTTDENQTDGAQ